MRHREPHPDAFASSINFSKASQRLKLENMHDAAVKTRQSRAFILGRNTASSELLGNQLPSSSDLPFPTWEKEGLSLT
jgi:hypothetical protein